MQKACGTGGTVKEGRIEIQGDQREAVARILANAGFQPVCVEDDGETSETCGTGEGSRFSELRIPNFELRIALVALGVHVEPFSHISPVPPFPLVVHRSHVSRFTFHGLWHCVIRFRRLTSSSARGTGCSIIRTGRAHASSITVRPPS